MVKRVWLGNNVSSSLTVGDKTVEPGGTITLTEGQEALLTRRGHRFAAPGSDEAKEAATTEGTATGVPPVPAPAEIQSAETPKPKK